MHINLEWFEELLAAYERAPHECNDWQQRFIESYSEKVEQYGDRTFVSSNQLEQLNRIAKIYGIEEKTSEY